MGDDGGTGDRDLNEGEQESEGTAEAPKGPKRVRAARGPFGAAIDPKVRAIAKDMYMNYIPRASICKQLNLNLKTFQTWAQRGNWYKTRETTNKDMTVEVLKRRAFALGNITNLSVEVLSKGLSQLAVKKDISLSEAYQVSMILSQLDKVVRLAQGEPTDVVEHKGEVGLRAIAFKTEKEIRAALSNDPMTNVKDIIPEHVYKDTNKPGIRQAGIIEQTMNERVAAEIKEEKGE